MRAVEALLRGAVDYAGLFPPAALDLQTTVENYAAYRAGQDAWALGRLVLPATRMAEFADRWPQRVAEWPISLLLGSDYDAELRLAVDAGMRLDVVECRPARFAEIREIRRRMPEYAMLFVESPAGAAVEDLLAAVADAGGCAKLRTGGVTAEAIPQPRIVAGFLVACAGRGLRMKATAGLHHAVRGEYPLTYEANAATASMHGFVNFFLAAAAAHQGSIETEVESILTDRNAENFKASADGISWRGRSFSTEEIRAMREGLAISFGSCSFEEPMWELRSMGWIE